MEIITKNAKETFDFGQNFAGQLKGGETLALVGDLGSGKTTFVQGLAKGLGVSSKIISPTFVLMREYKINYKLQITNYKWLYHIDLYRLESNVEQELKQLGINDLWDNKENIVVIEWADKAKSFMPENTIWITFEESGDEVRMIRMSS